MNGNYDNINAVYHDICEMIQALETKRDHYGSNEAEIVLLDLLNRCYDLCRSHPDFSEPLQFEELPDFSLNDTERRDKLKEWMSYFNVNQKQLSGATGQGKARISSLLKDSNISNLLWASMFHYFRSLSIEGRSPTAR